MTIRVGLGYDIHAFAAAEDERALVLAGVTVDGHAGLAGHSDADAVTHAVCDALLGAAGFDDLGTLFPASEVRWKNARSMDMLREVVARVTTVGWHVCNVDVVINAEVPRLAPHLDAMRDNLEALLGAGTCNVKPKRGESIGAIGRAEGIAVIAVALLER